MDGTTFDVLQPVQHVVGEYDEAVDEFVLDIVRSVGAEMNRQPASMVYEMITATVQRRLPGIPVDQQALREAAARIAAGYPVV